MTGEKKSKRKDLSTLQRISLGIFLRLAFVIVILVMGFVAKHSSGTDGKVIFLALTCFVCFGIAAAFAFILRWEIKIGQFEPWRLYILKRDNSPILFHFALALHVFTILISAGLGLYLLWLCFRPA